MDATAPDASWDTTVADHRQRQLLRIGRVAADLIAHRGVSEVSMSELARTVGISRATLYNYVPDIATAVRTYLATRSENFVTTVAAAVEQETGPEAKLRRYIREQVVYVAGSDHRAAAALHEAGAALGGADTPAAHRHRQSVVLDGILADGIQAGVFRQIELDTHATLVSRLLYSAHDLVHHHHLTEEATITAITSMVFDGIRPTDPVQPSDA